MNGQNKKSGEENNLKQEHLALNEGNKNTLLATLSYVSLLVLIPLIAEKEDSFVKFHIKQGLVLFIIEVLVYISGKLAYSLLPILGVINIALLILSIIGIVNVVKGRERELPLVGGLAGNFKF